jgi:hypothetical protein
MQETLTSRQSLKSQTRITQVPLPNKDGSNVGTSQASAVTLQTSRQKKLDRLQCMVNNLRHLGTTRQRI